MLGHCAKILGWALMKSRVHTGAHRPQYPGSGTQHEHALTTVIPLVIERGSSGANKIPVIIFWLC